MISASPKILIFTGGDIVANQYMNHLVPTLIEMGVRPIVFITPATTSEKAHTQALEHYGFYERDMMDNVVLPYLDSTPQAEGVSLSFNQIAIRYKCPVYRISSLDDPTVNKAAHADSTIGGLSVYNDAIFVEPLITGLKKKGFFWNLHHGLLPEQRGVFIPLRTLVAGNSHYGCTLHEIEKSIDTGNIVATYKRPLDRSQSVLQSYLDLVQGGAELITQAISQYLRHGAVETTPQLSKAAYHTFPTDAEVALATAQGIKLWGSPMEMFNLYTNLFGNHEPLSTKLIDAIAILEKKAVSLPSAQIAKVA